ncbi:MAG: phosphoglycerate dehydrogenase [Chloroflexi bacterium]|nr:phosphoglycerate dehydrogenase [Chloroflexota bacterium]
MPTVFIAIPFFVTRDPSPLDKLEAAGWTVKQVPEGVRPNEDQLIELLEGVDATVAGGEPYTRKVLSQARSLKHVARWGVGFDRVDLDAATDEGVLVTTTQGANDWGVADHAVALMLACGHLVVSAHLEMMEKGWTRAIGDDLWRQKVGIFGLGRIGRGVAQRVHGFEAEILGHDPWADPKACAELGIKLVSPEELLREADYVTLHLPLNADTHHFVNRERLALMKKTAYLVNTARGGLVNEDALYDALTSGQIAGAGLDVREQEPPTDTRFNTLPNVILSPHNAGITHQTVSAMSHMAVDSILSGWRGEKPHGLLTPGAWEKRRTFSGS